MLCLMRSGCCAVRRDYRLANLPLENPVKQYITRSCYRMRCPSRGSGFGSWRLGEPVMSRSIARIPVLNRNWPVRVPSGARIVSIVMVRIAT